MDSGQGNENSLPVAERTLLSHSKRPPHAGGQRCAAVTRSIQEVQLPSLRKLGPPAGLQGLPMLLFAATASELPREALATVTDSDVSVLHLCVSSTGKRWTPKGSSIRCDIDMKGRKST